MPCTTPRERRAHERELDEVLGADLGVGADVEQRHRLAGDRERERERRARDARVAADVEEPRGQRGAGRAGRDERVRVTGGDGARGAHDRGVRLLARGGDGVGGLRDRDRGIDDLDARRGRAELVGGAEEQDADALRGRERGPGSDLGRAEISAVGVDARP